MYAEKQEKYLSLLHDETSLALGCTEPGAVALAAAYAAAVLEEEVQKIKIIVSSYILKNGMNVGIPGTGMSGFSIAAADRKSTRLNSSHSAKSRMPSSA